MHQGHSHQQTHWVRLYSTHPPAYLYIPTHPPKPKTNSKMAVLYAFFKETKRKLTAEKRNTAYFKEEPRPTH